MVPRTGEGTILSILLLWPPTFMETNQLQKQLAVVSQSPTHYYNNSYFIILLLELCKVLNCNINFIPTSLILINILLITKLC